MVLLIPGVSSGRTLLTQQQALRSAFPTGTNTVRHVVFLSREEQETVRRLSGVELRDQMIIRYRGVRDGQLVGHAYFDAHRVRTLPETVMVVVMADGTIEKVEILSFSEPMDYFPKQRWLDQFKRRALDKDLSLKGAIRPISGASLTARAVLAASRKLLAVHQVIEARSPMAIRP